LQCLNEDETTVSALAVLPDGRYALSGSNDATLRLCDLQTGRLLFTIPGQKNASDASTLSPNGGHAPSGSSNRILRFYDQLGEEIPLMYHTIRTHGIRLIKEMHLLAAYASAINAVAVTSNGRCALMGSHNGTLQLWNLRTGGFMRSFVGHTDAVSAVALAADDQHALSGSADCTLLLWRVETGELLHSFTEHGGPITALAICADGRHGVSGWRDRTPRLWDLEKRICRAMVPLESAPLAVALASDGRTVVVGDRLGNVHRFQIRVK
jgi:WD40 repeat protein